MMKIESLIIDDLGNEQPMTLYTEATYQKKAKKSFLMYQETDISGMEGVKTLLTYDGDVVTIKRYGKVNSDLRLKLNQWEDNIYRTEYGVFIMKTFATQLKWEESQPLTIEMAYDLIIEEAGTSKVHVKITSQGEANAQG